MRVFVTGSTGLLGSNLVRELQGRGHHVTALARSPGKARAQLPPGVDVVIGDLDHPQGWTPALDGVDVLFHTAAYFRESYAPGNHTHALRQLNVNATLDLLDIASGRGVRRAVLTSSSGAIGMKPGDEDTPASETQLRNAYFRSKVEMDRAVADRARTHGPEIVTVLPGWMFGPHDAAPTSAGEIVLRFLRRGFPFALDGGTSVADARDVAWVMAEAAEHAQPGARYVASGPYVSFRELFDTLERHSGVKAPRLVAPRGAVETLARLADLAARLANRPSPLPLAGVRTMHLRHHVSAERAARELGATFRPLDDTVRDTLAWFARQDASSITARVTTT
ncbi:NAD-dependent epimerase/dehydratase family protein [Deinococcus pimensis]|uniref:NAD-dependent epimerase/dehydratase family protein n=1 Tax=Deinococcus pimensis TaxID=309888 RepID=UPI0004877726|nr:NAD-dependent epimerase/dehydratase family protein [Deinococcus pimensis]